MENKVMPGFMIAVFGLLLSAGSAKAAVLNGDEAFANSLTPEALARIELPKPASPVQPAILPYPKDSFSYLSECRIVDAQFIRQPSIPEAVQMLSGCMKQVSKQYKVTVRASAMVTPWGGPGGGAQGSTLSGILITVSGKISAGNPVIDHLSTSLQKRNGQLFGHKAVLSQSQTRFAAAESDLKGMNSVPASLKSAVKAAQRKELEDYGYLFGLSAYPAKTKLTKILADIIGYDEADINTDVFQMSSGDPAVRAFAKYLRAEAAAEGEDTLPESQIIAKSILNVSAESEKAFLGTQQFAKVQLASHNRQEDGDMDYWVLIAQEKDGSLQVLQYTRNPY